MYTFQDLIHKGYIIALAYGDIKKEILYTRIHSSCITSETFRSQDCDCVQQLYGAFKKISEKGNGILFYLIQEGRGCGYIGKSRACMHVQYQEDKITTFDAYKMLGMKKDYRDYTSVKDICYLLDINPKFILMTNNPDKIDGLTNLGFNIEKTETIEFKPNPFNQDYLISKQKTGHILYEAREKIQKYELNHQKCEPFIPYHLKNCKRFIHVASYYLPIKPINNKIIVSNDDYALLQKDTNYDITFTRLPTNNFLIKATDKLIKKFPKLLCKPYWFKMNCFFDVATHKDVLILQYGDCKMNPIVRIHSESIVDRFPILDRENRNKYKKSIQKIISHGSGLIIHFYDDGRGSGFGGSIINKKYGRHITGIRHDSRDYRGISHLIKEFIDPEEIILLYASERSQELSTQELKKANIIINKLIHIW
jgi:3,4-dihydroxy 2-butanone 4-phosphate synthase/GTP cyclohydrolase II